MVPAVRPELPSQRTPLKQWCAVRRARRAQIGGTLCFLLAPLLRCCAAGLMLGLLLACSFLRSEFCAAKKKPGASALQHSLAVKKSKQDTARSSYAVAPLQPGWVWSYAGAGHGARCGPTILPPSAKKRESPKKKLTLKRIVTLDASDTPS